METIIRVRKDYDADPFARIDKVPINDPNRSYKALGILTYVLSKPDGWEVNIKDLCNHATDQEKAVRSGIDELLKLKYCRRIKAIDAETKRIKKWLYVFYERPYSGAPVQDQVIEINPLPQNGKVDTVPLSGFPQVEKPQMEKPQMENGPPINKVFKQLTDILTKESTNNNTDLAAADPAAAVVVEIPKEKLKEYLKLEKRIINLGWLGSTKEIKAFFNADPEYLAAWIQKVEGIKGLKNPAGLLRQGLRSGERPIMGKEIERAAERKKLLDLGLSADEIEALT